MWVHPPPPAILVTTQGPKIMTRLLPKKMMIPAGQTPHKKTLNPATASLVNRTCSVPRRRCRAASTGSSRSIVGKV